MPDEVSESIDRSGRNTTNRTEHVTGLKRDGVTSGAGEVVTVTYY